MKIKQQKQIKAFLEKELGAKRGDALFARQDKALNELIKNTMGKSENQMKTLVQTVLPEEGRLRVSGWKQSMLHHRDVSGIEHSFQPVTVIQSKFNKPISANSFITAYTPPASFKSSM